MRTNNLLPIPTLDRDQLFFLEVIKSYEYQYCPDNREWNTLCLSLIEALSSGRTLPADISYSCLEEFAKVENPKIDHYFQKLEGIEKEKKQSHHNYVVSDFVQTLTEANPAHEYIVNNRSLTHQQLSDDLYYKFNISLNRDKKMSEFLNFVKENYNY